MQAFNLNTTQPLKTATLTVAVELPFSFEKEIILSENDKVWLEREETYLEDWDYQHLGHSDIDVHY